MKKEPIVGLLLNLIFFGIADIYVKKFMNGILKIIIQIIACWSFIIIDIIVNDNRNHLIIGNIISFLVKIAYVIFVLYDGYMTVKRYNLELETTNT